jgi:patatin-related protein
MGDATGSVREGARMSDHSATEQEVRFSVVLYGGVSLAIYISGVCAELLNLVRATQTKATQGPPTNAVERVYRAAAGLTDATIKRLDEQADLRDCRGDALVQALTVWPPRRKFVVDILSGSSAGGLNAIYLSRALTSGGDLGHLRQMWVEEGDIARLLNDERVDDADIRVGGGRLDGPWRALHSTSEPRSLLSGDRFYLALLDGLERMSGEGSRSEPMVEALDCFITTTDLDGVPTTVELSSNEVEERLHRVVSHLRYGTVEATGVSRNDFAPERDAFLAFVGRATAAHPAAFFPANLRDVDELLRKDPSDHRRSLDPDDPAWREIMKPSSEGLADAWFSDGGDMDNKPFSYVVAPVRTRRADRPVDRKVIYVEPSPGLPDPTRTGVRSEPGLGAVTIGAFNLGRTENIREDIDQIEARNRAVADLGETLSTIQRLFAASPHVEEWDIFERFVQSADNVTQDDIRSLGEQRDTQNEGWTKSVDPPSAQLSYELDRTRRMKRDLAERTVALAEAAPRSARAESIRAAVIDTLDKRQSATRHGELRHRPLLAAFDLQYRLRRLNFIDHMLSSYQREALMERGASGMEESDDGDTRALGVEPIASIRRLLNAEFVRLRAFEIVFWATDAVLARTKLDTATKVELDTLLPALRRELRAAASDLSPSSAVDQLMEAYQAVGARVMSEASVRSRLAICKLDDELRGRVQMLWDRFDTFDTQLLPLWEEIQGEIDKMEVVRISPVDARSIIDVRTSPRRKLGGDSLHHFGGFFDADWRRLDFMWGRLDAAEMLIRTLVPTSDDDSICKHVRDELIREAQIHILDDEPGVKKSIAKLSRPMGSDPMEEISDETSSARVLRYLQVGFDVDLSFAGRAVNRAQTKQDVISRAAEVVGRILGREFKRRDEAAVGASARRIGRLLQTSIDFSTPGAQQPRVRIARWCAIAAATIACFGAVWSAVIAPIALGWPLKSLAVTVAGVLALGIAAGCVFRNKHSGNGTERAGPSGLLHVVGMVFLAAWLGVQGAGLFLVDDTRSSVGWLAVQAIATTVLALAFPVFTDIRIGGGEHGQRRGHDMSRLLGWSVFIGGFVVVIIAVIRNPNNWRFGALGVASTLVLATLVLLIGASVKLGEALHNLGEPKAPERAGEGTNRAASVERL